MKQFAVFGNPIAHSKSPEIHTAFAEQFDIDLSYQKILADVGKFAPRAAAFFERGIGANVTVPFKEDALQFADKLSIEAQLAGAVNTLSRKNGEIIGDNTDGTGLVHDIQNNHHCPFNNKRVLIIGAGGASRGVILPIAKENPQSVTIVNRTYEKAQQLVQQFLPHVTHVEMTACSFEALNTDFDMIINATSASLSGQKLPLTHVVFNTKTLAYDMMYGAEPTSFMRFAQQHGATAVDGLGMLVEQAAKSFEIWHGIKPVTQPAIENIRRQL